MFVAYLRTRLALFAFGSALVLGQRCVLPRPPERNLAKFAAYLGAAVDSRQPVVVDSASVQWESSHGLATDLFWGRRVWFLGSTYDGGPRDVFRARVRVAPDGSPLQVTDWRNLTRTPLGDEEVLAVHDQTAVFSSRAYGELQGLSVFRLYGETDLGRGTPFNRLLLRLRAHQETGDSAGIERTHLQLLPNGPTTVEFDATTLRLHSEETALSATVDLAAHTVEQSGELVRSLSLQPYGGASWVHNLVDVARGVVGPAPLAWLESHVFHWQDWLRQRNSVGAPREAALLRVEDTAAAPEVWPPNNVSPLLQDAEPTEGVWQSAGFDVAPDTPFGSGPDSPAFARTWLRPDPKRPYARLYLVAMDMRRLGLGMEAGFEEPKPKTGPPGRGALTNDPAVRQRVVATFNGAFKSMHGDYGMMVDGRVLVPPKPRAASVVVRKDGWVGLGTWPDTLDVPTDVRHFRQNLDPLIADGRVNPTGREEWGLRLASGSVVTERSALCRAQGGQLVYAWGSELTGESLARGLESAGCTYAVHLDMNPGHAGMVFTRIRGAAPEGVQGQLAVPEMSIHPKEHAVWSDKDFFYLTERETSLGTAKDAGRVDWAPSAGPQPAPESWPAIWSGKTQLGNLTVSLMRIEPGRVRHTLTASSLEPLVVGQAAPRREVTPEERARALVAISFGHTTSRTRYGMVFGRRVTLPLRSHYGNLVVREGGAVETLEAQSELSVGEGDAVVQLPMLVSGGVVTSQASLRGGRRVRGGLCELEGRLWLATVDHDSSDPVAVTLRNVGCSTVLELDRGSKHAVEVQRDDWTMLDAPERETGYLWVLGAPMVPRTYEF